MAARPYLCVYLVLEEDEKILLGLRQNTGYEDEKYALVAGHAEEGESAIQAICREAKEEIGITILPQNLEVIHIMHSLTNRENLNIFMRPKKYSGIIQNMEPDKCVELKFFPKDKLPANLSSYVPAMLSNLENKAFYSEYGWEK